MGDVVPDGVRAVGLFGHSGCGKTTLAESLLYGAGALDRRGKVDEGTSSLDQEPEEQRRHISLSLAVGSAQVGGKALYLLDTPGYLDFVGEVRAVERVVDLALLVVDAAEPVEVGLELEFQRLRDRGMPCMIFVNKLDRENANASDALATLRGTYGNALVALDWPLGREASLHGTYAVWSGKSEGSDGKPLEETPSEAASLRDQLSECVAEADDEALEQYLDAGELSDDLLLRAIGKAVASGVAVPVLFGSASTMAGVRMLLSVLGEFGVAPRPVATESVTIQPDAAAEASAFVFKTTADPHVGRLSLLRVLSGRLRSDSHLTNLRQSQEERLGQLYRLRGQKQEPVAELLPGEIGAVARLQDTKTGDTLAAKPNMAAASPIGFEEPVFRLSLKARSTADEDRLSGALGRLLEEDPTLRLEHPSGHETVVAGLGEMHLEVLHDRLKRKFGVDVDMELPEVPFRETIRGSVKVEGKHKKQTGGHGQFGHVWLELSPLEGGDFVFEDKIFGGVVPAQYRPAVEKGVLEAMNQGILAGFPVTGVRCALVDGSYHAVDSSEMAFKVAGALAFREGSQKARPVLLEPVDEIWVDCPESAMGDIIGVINRKRGRVLGMESEGGRSRVHAFVPRMEIQRYAIELRSLAGGRASFRQSFAQYEEVPAQIAQQIMQKAKATAH
jgi:elongation factor G